MVLNNSEAGDRKNGPYPVRETFVFSVFDPEFEPYTCKANKAGSENEPHGCVSDKNPIHERHRAHGRDDDPHDDEFALAIWVLLWVRIHVVEISTLPASA